MTEDKSGKGGNGSGDKGGHSDRETKKSDLGISAPGFGIPSEHYQQVPRPDPTKGDGGKRGGGEGKKGSE